MAEELSNIIYIAHLPAGFEEKEMKVFFKQFGVVKNVQLARSSKTGNSKGYGWVEFESQDVAKTTAEAFNGYLMNDKIIKTKHMTIAEVPPKLFTNAIKGPKKRVQKEDPPRKETALKLARQEKKIKATLEAAGIDYQWPSLLAQFEAKGIPVPDAEQKKAETKEE